MEIRSVLRERERFREWLRFARISPATVIFDPIQDDLKTIRSPGPAEPRQDTKANQFQSRGTSASITDL